MAVLTHLETDTGTNVDISSATAVGAYTANGDKLIMVDVSIDAVAGNGDYVMYVKRQINGTGSSYVILPKTTMTAASGETAISGQSGWITVRNGDVLTVYVDGLAGDTTTPDWTTRWFEGTATGVTLADDAITAAALKADAVTKIQTGLATPTNITAAAGVALSAAGVDAILDEVVVGSYTLRQLVKVMAAALAGKATGGGTTTVTFRGVDDASDVIVATVDANGNRSEVVLTV